MAYIGFMRFDPTQIGLRRWFGPLETEIMDLVWDSAIGDDITVRRIHRLIVQTRPIAYTTVMTTMGRLFDKGVLERTERPGKGNAYIYTPVCSREQFEDDQLAAVLAAVDDVAVQEPK